MTGGCPASQSTCHTDHAFSNLPPPTSLSLSLSNTHHRTAPPQNDEEVALMGSGGGGGGGDEDYGDDDYA